MSSSIGKHRVGGRVFPSSRPLTTCVVLGNLMGEAKRGGEDAFNATLELAVDAGRVIDDLGEEGRHFSKVLTVGLRKVILLTVRACYSVI